MKWTRSVIIVPHVTKHPQDFYRKSGEYQGQLGSKLVNNWIWRVISGLLTASQLFLNSFICDFHEQRKYQCCKWQTIKSARAIDDRLKIQNAINRLKYWLNVIKWTSTWKRGKVLTSVVKNRSQRMGMEQAQVGINSYEKDWRMKTNWKVSRDRSLNGENSRNYDRWLKK